MSPSLVRFGLPTSHRELRSWQQTLEPSLKKNPWTEEEEQIIHDAQLRLGNRWADIAKLLNGRSDSAVKAHWYATVHKNIGRHHTNVPGSGGGEASSGRDGIGAGSGVVNSTNSRTSTVDPRFLGGQSGGGGGAIGSGGGSGEGGGGGGYGEQKPNVVPGEAGIVGASSAPVRQVGGSERLLQPVVAGLGVCGGIEPSFTTGATSATTAALCRGAASVASAAAMGNESTTSPALVPTSTFTLGGAPSTLGGDNRWQVRSGGGIRCLFHAESMLFRI